MFTILLVLLQFVYDYEQSTFNKKVQFLNRISRPLLNTINCAWKQLFVNLVTLILYISMYAVETF